MTVATSAILLLCLLAASAYASPPTEDQVILTTGETVTGEIVDLLPGQYVVIRQPDGRSSTIMWTAIKMVNAAARPGDADAASAENNATPLVPLKAAPNEERVQEAAGREEAEAVAESSVGRECEDGSTASPCSAKTPDTPKKGAMPKKHGKRPRGSVNVGVSFDYLMLGYGSELLIDIGLGGGLGLQGLYGSELPDERGGRWHGVYGELSTKLTALIINSRHPFLGYYSLGGSAGYQWMNIQPYNPAKPDDESLGFRVGPYIGASTLLSTGGSFFASYGGVIGLVAAQRKLEKDRFKSGVLELRISSIPGGAETNLNATYYF